MDKTSQNKIKFFHQSQKGCSAWSGLPGRSA